MNQTTRLIKLTMGEIADIFLSYRTYKIDPQENVQPNWVSKQFHPRGASFNAWIMEDI